MPHVRPSSRIPRGLRSARRSSRPKLPCCPSVQCPQRPRSWHALAPVPKGSRVPDYLAPAAYVEETSFRAKRIEGVATSVTAFVGPTLRGPNDDICGDAPDALYSFKDFERAYGDCRDLCIDGKVTRNYVALAAKAFFDNGGRLL